MKIEMMKKPGDTLNVKCTWCDEPSSYSVSKGGSNQGIFFYACAKHQGNLEAVAEQFKRYKRLGKVS